MAVRFTRVFGLYTFFSVFLPGMLFLLGVAPLIFVVFSSVSDGSLFTEVPAQRLVAVFGVLVSITLGMFVGFWLHTLGAGVEKQIGELKVWHALLGGVLGVVGVDLDDRDLSWLTVRVGKRHRELFYEMLNSRHDAVHADLVSSFITVANEQFPPLNLDPMAPRASPDGEDASQNSDDGDSTREADADGDKGETETDDAITEEQANALYTLVRGQIHMDQRGRSRTFQAVSASCRSMFVAWAFLTFAYTLVVGGMFLITNGVTAETLPVPDVLQNLVSVLWLIDTEPPSAENLTRAFVFVVTIGFIGMYGFASVARNSKRYYLQYLVGDFLLLQDGDSDEDSEDRRAAARSLRP